jgi:hypothetical protein
MLRDMYGIAVAIRTVRKAGEKSDRVCGLQRWRCATGRKTYWRPERTSVTWMDDPLYCAECGIGISPGPESFHLARGTDLLGGKGSKHPRFRPMFDFCSWNCLVGWIDDETAVGPLPAQRVSDP